MNYNIEIPLSKNKLFLGIGLSILFVVLGAFLFTHASDFNNTSSLLKSPLVVKSIGLLSISFFGAICIYGIRKLFNNEFGLIINKNGIIDNSNASSIGLIEWNDILDIHKKQILSSSFLLVKVKNPEKYIAKAKNKIHARLIKSNMKMYGTPISITPNTLKIDFNKLENLLTNYLKNELH